MKVGCGLRLALLAVLAVLQTVPGWAAGKGPKVAIERWELPGISSPLWESHPAIDPSTGDLWFVRSDRTFSGWRILVSRCRDGHWSRPQDMPFTAPGIEADPYFSADGATLFFISSRSTGAKESRALDIWKMRRTPDGQWQPPELLPAPVNSDQAEWFPRPGADGWLYFGSRRAGGSGKDDIWRAREDEDGQWVVENAGAGLNTPGAEYEFMPATDGKWGVLSTDAGLYRAVRGATGWRRAGALESINTNRTEIGPLLSASGRTLLFSKDSGDAKSGELFIAHLAGRESWPPRCHAAK